MKQENTQSLKDAVGEWAADRLVTSGMRIGAGTGSTAESFILALGKRIRSGQLRDVLAVPTGYQSAGLCRDSGIPVRSFDDPEIDGALDIAFDGADEIDAEGRLTKGGGAAQTMEKIVAQAAGRFVVLAGYGKLVTHLGQRFPIAIEVMPAALRPVLRRVQELGATASVRAAQRKMGPVISDSGNLIVDLSFSASFEPVQMERELEIIPGVLGSGLFCSGPYEFVIAHSQTDIRHSKGRP